MMEQGIVLATPTTIEQTGNRQPWERLPDEPTQWYDAYLVYRNLGAQRSILSAYREHRRMLGYADYRDIKVASGDWYKNSHLYDWEKRATLYDDHIIRQAEAEAEALVKQWYVDSRRDLVHYWNDLRVEYDGIDEGNMSKSQVIAATKTINQQLTPTSPSQSIDVQIILDKLPADVQSALLDSLTK